MQSAQQQLWFHEHVGNPAGSRATAAQATSVREQTGRINAWASLLPSAGLRLHH
jgi:hypothetical protein